MSAPFRFLDLPLELREHIYHYYFNPAGRLQVYECHGGGRYHFEFGLYRVCRQIYEEAQTVFRRENAFVKVETPWPTADVWIVHHISTEGNVPIVAAGHLATAFKHHHASIQISAPQHGALPEHTIILLLPDVHLFCQTWYYSALSFEDLNSQLCLTFVLRDPYYPADPKPVARGLQKTVLSPFVKVKGLYDVEFEGGWDERLVQETRKGMAEPAPSVRQCCEEATSTMEEGDRALAENHPSEALELYKKAFFAVHILISKRERRVLADGFFHAGIEGGRFNGQSGTTVRIILRIRLVSRTTFAYLRLGEYGEAAFWGMRSIRIMREAMDTEFEDFITEFIGSGDVGLIHVRTAIAFSLMYKEGGVGQRWGEELEQYAGEDYARADTLWRLSEKYLKGPAREAERKMVLKEAKEFGVRIPEGVFGSGGGGGSERGEVDSMAHLNLGVAEKEANDAGTNGNIG